MHAGLVGLKILHGFYCGFGCTDGSGRDHMSAAHAKLHRCGHRYSGRFTEHTPTQPFWKSNSSGISIHNLELKPQSSDFMSSSVIKEYRTITDSECLNIRVNKEFICREHHASPSYMEFFAIANTA